MRPLLLAGCLSFVLAAAAVADPGAAPQTADTAAGAKPAAPQAPKSAKPAKKVKSPPPAAGEPKADSRKSPAEIRKVGDTYLKLCLRDWDAATHMTRTEWDRTCRRVARDRVRFMIDQMDK